MKFAFLTETLWLLYTNLCLILFIQFFDVYTSNNLVFGFSIMLYVVSFAIIVGFPILFVTIVYFFFDRDKNVENLSYFSNMWTLFKTDSITRIIF